MPLRTEPQNVTAAESRTTSTRPLRAIIHIDLDCFYAQVEIVRLNLPPATPLVVVQWGSVLAVSYPARKFGIKRGDKVADVRRKSGSETVHIISVETIGPSSLSTAGSYENKCNVTFQDNSRNVKEREKVSLSRYRNASAKVFSVIASLVDNFERASVDECFIDVTNQTEARLRAIKCEGNDFEGESAYYEATECSQVVLAMPSDTAIIGEVIDWGAVHDRFLIVAARIASEIRQSIWQQCKFTCSAGIAMNKMLAKFASAANKPNMQTVAPVSAVHNLLTSVPLKKIRGCGGKISSSLEALGYLTAGDVRDRMGMDALRSAVGSHSASFVWNVVRGHDYSQVVAREQVKTVLAAKNFEISHRVETAISWLRILAKEVVERVTFEETKHNRFARSLILSARVFSCNLQSMASVSRTGRMPCETVSNREDSIVELASAMLVKIIDGPHFRLPITFVGLTAGNFAIRACGKFSITAFLKPEAGKATVAHGIPAQDDEDLVAHSDLLPPAFDDGGREKHGKLVIAEKTSTTGIKDIASFLNRDDSSCKSSQPASGSDLVHQRRLQEASDLELARKILREDSVSTNSRKIKKCRTANLHGQFFKARQ